MTTTIIWLRAGFRGDSGRRGPGAVSERFSWQPAQHLQCVQSSTNSTVGSPGEGADCERKVKIKGVASGYDEGIFAGWTRVVGTYG